DAGKVLVQIAADGDRAAGLDEGLVVVVGAELPGAVLTVRDARGAGRIHRPLGPAPSRLGRALPGADDPGPAIVEADDGAQIVEDVRLVVVDQTIRIHSFDVDDVELARS